MPAITLSIADQWTEVAASVADVALAQAVPTHNVPPELMIYLHAAASEPDGEEPGIALPMGGSISSGELADYVGETGKLWAKSHVVPARLHIRVSTELS